MYGQSIGTLFLSLNSGTTQTTLVQYDRNQGDKWFESTQYVGSKSNFNLQFTYLYNPSFFFLNGGNAALDDIRFIDCNPRVKVNSCARTKSNWQCVFTGECIAIDNVCDGITDCTDGSDEDLVYCSALPAYCDFESDLCAYTQRRDDDFDWLRQSGATGSVSTGPTSDHSLGTSRGELRSYVFTAIQKVKSMFIGYYIYIETSSPRVQLEYADLSSPLMAPPPRVGSGPLSCSVRFCYHMYGSSIGYLAVDFENADGRREIWRVHGNQGDRWVCDKVALDLYIQNINYQVPSQRRRTN